MEGPARFFVDQVNPMTNKTYCQGLRSEAGLSPLQVHRQQPTAWGPVNQRAVRGGEVGGLG